MVNKLGAGLIAFTLALGILPLGSHARRQLPCDGQDAAHAVMSRADRGGDERLEVVDVLPLDDDALLGRCAEVLLHDDPR